MKRSIRVPLLIVVPLVLFAGYAVLARTVLHGPVDGASLAAALVREVDSADATLGVLEPCRRAGSDWECTVSDASGSGRDTYRVRVRRGSSCFEARPPGADGDQRAIADGCVRRWQWTLLDLAPG